MASLRRVRLDETGFLVLSLFFYIFIYLHSPLNPRRCL